MHTWESLIRDLRFGFRQLRKKPVVVAVAVLSLALGIGANTAIFTLIDAIMLQSLPVRDSGQLVLFYTGIMTGTMSGNAPRSRWFSYPFWKYLKAHDDAFEQLCAFRQGIDRVMMHLAGVRNTPHQEQASVDLVSGNFFKVLGVDATEGRVLRPADDTVRAPRVAVISYDYWLDRFHRDPAAIGKTVVLNGTAFTIVGVAAHEFFGVRVHAPPDYWLPFSFQPQILQQESWVNRPDEYWLNLMGRLKPGQTIRSADAAVDIRLHQYYIELAGSHVSASLRRKIQSVHVDLKPGGGGISWLRFRYSQPLHVLMAVVGLVLLIACANLAILVLARTSGRRQEFLSRAALGASRIRLIRQILTESVLLSFLGGAAGVLVAYWCVEGLVSLFGVPASIVKVRPDLPVLAFTIGISVLTGIVFGIIPALKYSGIELRAAAGARSAEFGTARFGSVQALIVLQVALSLVLLLGAGLLAHSLVALETQNLGFAQKHILLVRTDPRLAKYQPAQLYPLYRQLYQRLNTLPGVVSATLARYTPESGANSSDRFSLRGYTPPPQKKMRVWDAEIGPGYFATLQTPVLRGRAIDTRDTPATPPVAVVNQTFVRDFLPHQNPIGRRISMGSSFKSPGIEIVGVVADSKYYGLRDKPEPMAFFSAWQGQPGEWGIYCGELILRTKGNASGVIPEVKKTLSSIDSRLPVLDVTTLSSQIDNALEQQKIITSLCSTFGILALLLAAVGIYGTMAYAVARRTTEIGIRMALGAQRGDILWMILRNSVILIAAGVVIGFPLALAGTHWIRSFLFGVSTADPVAIGAAVALIAALALLAGYLPARRAAKIDPMSAIRYE